MRQLRDSADPFALSENVFRGMYRLSRQMVRALVEEIRPYFPVPARAVSISIEVKVRNVFLLGV